MQTVPVIILNYNSSGDCEKCIKFLQRQSGVCAHIIVVDNYSSGQDLAHIREVCKKFNCTLIENRENRGYNAGNNIGLRYAAKQEYEFALIANPDMEFPQTDYLATLIAAMQKDQSVAVIGSDIVSPNGQHQNPMRRDGEWQESWWWFGELLKIRKSHSEIGSATTRYCDKVSGCCLLVRMDFMREIGFFDENVFLYCEEAILSRQVEGAGKRILYLADAQAVHAHIPSQKGDPTKRFRNWLRSRRYFIRHYNGESVFSRAMMNLSAFLYANIFILKAKLKR